MAKGSLYLNSEIRKKIEWANDRAGRLGLHIVHIFGKDIISGEPVHRSGYFEEYAEAELFAMNNLETLSSIHNVNNTFIILLDNKIYGGKYSGDDAKAFMATEDEMNRREYIKIGR